MKRPKVVGAGQLAIYKEWRSLVWGHWTQRHVAGKEKDFNLGTLEYKPTTLAIWLHYLYHQCTSNNLDCKVLMQLEQLKLLT